MPVVAMFSGSYCHGEAVAKETATRCRLVDVGEHLIPKAARKIGVVPNKLAHTAFGAPSVFNRFTRDREKSVAGLRVTLAELIAEDNVLIQGCAVHLLPRTIKHVLTICLAANFDYRVKQAATSLEKDEKEARKIIRSDDKTLLEWTRYIADTEPYDASLYDVVIPMQDNPVSEAVRLIEEQLANPAVQADEGSRQVAADFLTASRVNLALSEKGHEVDVSCVDGVVTIVINRYITRLEKHEEQLRSIALTVPGVKAVQTRVGATYNPPTIYPMEEFQMPKKILLVDDEREFVHTLSERLSTRRLDSTVAYDGEEALTRVAQDEPDVMVLDLKMPGIDGIEVLRRLKHSNPLVEVIILTGHGSENEEQIAADLGAFAYLRKPVNIDVLAQTMREAYQKVSRKREGIDS